MKKTKFEKIFVEKNKQIICEKAFSNAERLFKEGSILISNICYSRACHLLLSGLEEVAKSNMLKSSDLDETAIKKLIDHKSKAEEIFYLSAFYYSGRQPTDEEREWAKERIPQMLEDTMYVRLKTTHDNQIEPDDKYWKKRAKSFQKLLKMALDDYNTNK